MTLHGLPTPAPCCEHGPGIFAIASCRCACHAAAPLTLASLTRTMAHIRDERHLGTVETPER